MLTQKISDHADVRIMGIAVASSVACIVDSMARIHLWTNGTFQTLDEVKEICTSVCLSVAASPDRFLVGAGNGYIVGVDTNGTIIDCARVHQSGVNAIAIAGNNLFVSVSDDQSISVLKFSGDTITRLSHVANASTCSIRAIAVRGFIAVTTGTDRRVSVWTIDIDSGDLELACILPTCVTDPLSIAFVSDSEIIVAGRGIERMQIPAL
jgi:WD40 repeat protein